MPDPSPKDQKRGVGRPEFQPTDRDRQQVKKMAGLGLGIEKIAAIIGVAEATLRKHFETEIAVGRASGVLVGAGKLMEAVNDGAPWAIQFYLTQRGGDEFNAARRSKSEITGPDGASLVPAPSFKIVFSDEADEPLETVGDVHVTPPVVK